MLACLLAARLAEGSLRPSQALAEAVVMLADVELTLLLLFRRLAVDLRRKLWPLKPKRSPKRLKDALSPVGTCGAVRSAVAC